MASSSSSAATSSGSPFSTMEAALAAFKRGDFVVVMDDENRENEGDLLIAASECTTEKMAWFIKHTRSVQSISSSFGRRSESESAIGPSSTGLGSAGKIRDRRICLG